MSLSELFAKISALPEDQRAEVERVVDAITQHKEPDTDAWDTDRSRESKKPRKAGFLKGTFVMHDDFDIPMKLVDDLPEPVENMGGDENYRSEKTRNYGFFEGPVYMSDDFDEPLECMKGYME